MTTRDKAYTYFDRIGDGHRNAIKRPFDSRVDRIFRRLIEEANNNGDCIISGDNGYYRPIPSDEVDNLEYNKYLKEEQSKVESMRTKHISMRVAYEMRRYK